MEAPSAPRQSQKQDSACDRSFTVRRTLGVIRICSELFATLGQKDTAVLKALRELPVRLLQLS